MIWLGECLQSFQRLRLFCWILCKDSCVNKTNKHYYFASIIDVCLALYGTLKLVSKLQLSPATLATLCLWAFHLICEHSFRALVMLVQNCGISVTVSTRSNLNRLYSMFFRIVQADIPRPRIRYQCCCSKCYFIVEYCLLFPQVNFICFSSSHLDKHLPLAPTMLLAVCLTSALIKSWPCTHMITLFAVSPVLRSPSLDDCCLLVTTISM